MSIRPFAAIAVAGAVLVASGCSSSSEPTAADLNPKAATETTIEANEQMEATVASFDEGDFEAAAANRIANLPDPVITGEDGRIVWDSTPWSFLTGEAPDTVNPSLWRLQKLNNETGLFKVADGVYQFRGYDMASMILIQGETGWIAADTTTTAAVARAGLKLAQDTLNDDRPVVAVIYTHSHSDHFGGVRGVVDEKDVESGKVKIYAPKDFLDYAVAENVLAGNAMSRRAQYQFGVGLPINAQGTVGTGLGLGLSDDSPGLIPPTDYINKTGEERTIDGVPMVFQIANGTEAPSEMMFYLPEQKALCVAEVANQVMHNVYTIRGAQVRDSLLWSKVLNETLDLFPDADVAFGTHHWPVRGKEKVRDFLETQRDTYRFIHDRALYLANSGLSMNEIGNADFFPAGLASTASSRGYYGTLSHNLRAAYQFYLGFYDANPATLDPLPRTESATKYVEAMGGIDNVIEEGQKAYDAGDYRWVVELVNNAVFADPSNERARALQADALEQLGYQAEAATWRNAYLSGATELRNGITELGVSSANADTVRGMSNQLLFDFLAIQLDSQKTDGVEADVQIELTDSNETWALELSHGVLNNTEGRELANPDVKLTLTRPVLLALLVQGTPLTELAEQGKVKVEGDPTALASLQGAVAEFTPDFNLVTPPEGTPVDYGQLTPVQEGSGD